MESFKIYVLHFSQPSWEVVFLDPIFEKIKLLGWRMEIYSTGTGTFGDETFPDVTMGMKLFLRVIHPETSFQYSMKTSNCYPENLKIR